LLTGSGCPGLTGRLAARRRGGAAPRRRGPAAGRRGSPNNAMFQVAGKMYHNFKVQWSERRLGVRAIGPIRARQLELGDTLSSFKRRKSEPIKNSLKM
jgi:hypothetical protein